MLVSVLSPLMQLYQDVQSSFKHPYSCTTHDIFLVQCFAHLRIFCSPMEHFPNCNKCHLCGGLFDALLFNYWNLFYCHVRTYIQGCVRGGW